MTARAKVAAAPVRGALPVPPVVETKHDVGADAAAARPAVPYQFAQLAIAAPTADRVEITEPEHESEREAQDMADNALGRAAGGADDGPVAPRGPGGLRLARAVDDPAAEPPASGFVVEDDAETLLAGQLRKSELLRSLREAVCAAANRELAAAGRDTEGCPYLDRWFAYYATRDARMVERALRRYAPEAARATSAAGYVPIVAARAAEGARHWVQTGGMPALPDGVTAAMLTGGGGVLGAIGGALSSIAGLFFKAEPGGAAPGVDRGALTARLGGGQPLDAGTRARMGGAFGYDFSQVRVHADPEAAATAAQLNARAFTLGTHVAFARDQYRPGDAAGDALLAHELAHVIQQRGARAPAGDSDPHAERDADHAAIGAVAALYLGDDTAERAPGVSSGLRLARCHRDAPARMSESASAAMSRELIASAGFDRLIEPFRTALVAATNLDELRAAVAQHGLGLWTAATRRAQGATANTDDRPLYWAREAFGRVLQDFQPRAPLTLSDADRRDLARQLEETSRGRTTAQFSGAEGVKRILISGFDPFDLDPRASANGSPAHGNPSGAAVLALDGSTVSSGALRGEVQGVIFPVRFADFNAGAVERFFGPYLDGSQPVDMIMTISQGGHPDRFQVEEFAGRRRSSGDFRDNAGQVGGGTENAPVVPRSETAGPEFLPTALPTDNIRATLAGNEVPADRQRIQEIVPGNTGPTSATAPTFPAGTTPPSGYAAVSGTGGGFLSNEIFYRVSALRRANGATVPMGHLHTPLLRVPTGTSDPAFVQQRDGIVQTIREILNNVLTSL